jgi:SAM-dependent methyltransferase
LIIRSRPLTRAPRGPDHGAMSALPKSAIFWEIHAGLPREGPGDDLSTRMAYGMLQSLPRAPRILDIACGPGMQTLELARLSDGVITAVDLHQPFLNALRRRARTAGLDHLITTRQASMEALPFEPSSLDLIWCEGAIYIVGFERGLTLWRPLLADGGCIAVTECCWLKPNPPEDLRAFWAGYPGMADIAAAQAVIARTGLGELGHFVLPDSAWWDHYYGPMEARIAALEHKHAGDASALAELAEARVECDLRRRYPDWYGYVFFVMRKAG